MNVKVSILMAVHLPDWNYFVQAMRSIQEQTYQDFELILVNDGVDKKELDKHMASFSFLYKIIDNAENLGLTRSLNKGMAFCEGEYIARFDDDDIMKPERLEKQVAFLDSYSEYAAVFSCFERINAIGMVEKDLSIVSEDQIVKFLLFRGNCLCHSSLMIRKTVLCNLDGYDATMLYAQDYDLYLRLLEKNQFYRLPETLVQFRIGSNRTSAEKSIMSMCCAYYASMKYAKRNCHFFLFVRRTIYFVVSMIKIIFMNKVS